MSEAPSGLLLVQVINELILKMYFWDLTTLLILYLFGSEMVLPLILLISFKL